MRLLSLVVVSLLLSYQGVGQTIKNEFRNVTIVLKDSSRIPASINWYQIIQTNTLVFKESKNQPYSLQDINLIISDSTSYLIRAVKNVKDSLKVVVRAIDGKISVYTSPAESERDEIFVEKDGVVYELQKKRVYANGRTFSRDEYKLYLRSFVADCSGISETKVNNLSFNNPSILKLVSTYNKSCGWEKSLKVVKSKKPRINIGIEGGGTYYNTKLIPNYDATYYGKRSVSGIGAGLFLKLNFKRNAQYLIADLRYEKLSGGGEVKAVRYGIAFLENCVYDISEIQNSYSLYFNIARMKRISISAAPGFLFQLQLSNKSMITDSRNFGYPPNQRSAVASNDKFGFSPVANLMVNFGRFNLRYQAVALAMQLKDHEALHLENKISLLFQISNR